MDQNWTAVGTRRGTIGLLHGVTGSAKVWWRVGPVLAEAGYDVVAIDLPGHGDAARVDRIPDLEYLVDAVAERLPPVDLLAGHSLGSAIAVALAGRDPSVARAVVLEDPPAMNAFGATFTANTFAGDHALLAADPAAFRRYLARTFPTWLEEDLVNVTESLSKLQVPEFVASLRGPLGWDMPALIKALPQPVLVIAASDVTLPDGRPPSTALQGGARAAVAELVGAERFVVLPGGHAVHREAADGWLAAVLGFAAAVL